MVQNSDKTFSIFVASSDPILINKQFMYKLEFTYPDVMVIPPLNPYFVITAKCIVKQVF